MVMELEQEDKIISEFLHSIGPWSRYVIIGGGYALMIYKLYLTDQKLENSPVGTRDIDSLIPRKVPEISKKNIAKHLSEAGFIHIFKDFDQPATEAYTKEIDGCEVEIEFLTDSITRHDKNKNVVIAGIVAQPLSYLTLSLQMTKEFTTHCGNAGIVVSPGAWMFHKSLTFVKRKTISKLFKDLYGVWYVATQLGEFSEEATMEFDILSARYPKWSKIIQSHLSHWIENAAPFDWAQLEMQDPSGRLRRMEFELAIKKLVRKG